MDTDSAAAPPAGAQDLAAQLQRRVAELEAELEGRRRLEAEFDALQRVRQAVWQMARSDDIARLAVAVRQVLVDLGLPVQDTGLNFIHTPVPGNSREHRRVTMAGGQVAYVSHMRDDPGDLVARFWRGGRTVYRPDLDADDPYGERPGIPLVFDHRVRAVVDIPFSHGTLAVNSDRPNAFGPRDLELLERVAGVVSEGFRRLADLQRLEQHAREVERTSASLQQLTQDLRRSNSELEQFAYVASHDLREPLRKIATFADRLHTLARDRLTPREQDYLERLNDAARRMGALISGLLLLSRVTTLAEPFVEVDLARVARDVLEDLEVAVVESGAQVEVGPLPTLWADPTQMHQLLQNLLSNALKFRKPGQAPVVRVTSEPTCLEPGGRTACALFVADDGIGFDPRYAERVFSVFERLHGRDEYEGTGIGLAICRKIAERHAGTITAQAQPGRGAVFTVVLPVEPGSVAP